jgi:hypothetical protein
MKSQNIFYNAQPIFNTWWMLTADVRSIDGFNILLHSLILESLDVGKGVDV